MTSLKLEPTAGLSQTVPCRRPGLLLSEKGKHFEVLWKRKISQSVHICYFLLSDLEQAVGLSEPEKPHLAQQIIF